MRKNGCVAIGDTDMYYAAFGEGQKKLVVLPGLSDGLATVKGKAWILASPYRKFFQDYTVYMFSRKNEMPEGYTIRDMADDQAQAMERLGIDRAYVLGVSQGGMIAQCLAIGHPERVAGLILAVTAPSANAVAQAVVSGWIGMAKRGDHTALMVDTAEKMYSEAYLRKNGRFFPLIARLTKPTGRSWQKSAAPRSSWPAKTTKSWETTPPTNCTAGSPAATCMFTKAWATARMRKRRIFTAGCWISAIGIEAAAFAGCGSPGPLGRAAARYPA